MPKISRRNFLQGAGLLALGGLAAGGLTGCGEGFPVATAASNESRGQYGPPSWLGEPPVIAESEITETIDTEVLVVGCRTGGLPAVISAAENGAKVLGIDRTDDVLNPREDIGAINSKLQQATIEQFPEMAIDKKECIEDIVRYANGFVLYDLVKLWADESGAMLDWVTDIVERDGRMVMEHEGSIGRTDQGARDHAYATGHSPQKTDKGNEDPDFGFGVSLKEYAEEVGGQFRWSTNFVKCETDDQNRVVGAICQDVKDQHYIRINAPKGVILATGGYGNNLEMMADRQSWNQSLRIAAPGSGGNPTGDGIKAAMWLGAAMDPLGAAVTFNRCCVKPDQTAGDGVVGRWFWMGEQPFMKVNLNGKRFCNESGPYDYMLHSTYMQPYHTYVTLWDANYPEHARQFEEVGCCRLYPFDNGAQNNIPMQVVIGMNDKLIEDGYIQQANTIEELAQKLNLPVNNLVESVQKYNAAAAAGVDSEYFKEPYRIIALDTPPYYGVRQAAWFLATLDGVLINTKLHPINEQGEQIDGLYCVGDCSGGFFSVSYPNLMTGLACGRTFTWGKLAGQYAATGDPA